ncbi:MAG: glycoside hydrolase family 43 protein [Lentisphaerae bacterium]|nr:glycoside hydrolase family 43 protein [Lentisphaerota bacterium]
MRYTGNENVDVTQPGGGLRLAVGAQSYQVLRTFRHDPAASDGLGWTYHHEPMITYRNGRFYLACKTNPVDEDIDPGCVLLFTSDDEARTWSSPTVLFPTREVAPGDWTFIAMRLGFWIAPAGRLYAMADYIPQSGYTSGDYCDWLAYGVAVREIKADGTFGPIHFVVENPTLYPRASLPFPYYTASADAAFKADCEALRADKIATLSWWEPIRPENFAFPKSLTDFIAKIGHRSFAKAPCVYRRADGALVALWKNSYAALSHDDGATWSEPVQLKTMGAGFDKIWSQRTADGRFVCSWTPRACSAIGQRLPLLVTAGDDGIVYSGDMLCVNNEAYQRYEGRYKCPGPSNYQRGLVEGHSETPPGADLWLTYSMGKEDIWISRIPLPLRGTVDHHIHDTFNDMETGGVVRDWNIYSPKYAPVRVVEFPSATDKSLELRDMDPFDFAKAERVFPEGKVVRISFRLMAKQTTGRLEIEVCSRTPGNYRPVLVSLGPNGRIGTPHRIHAAYQPETWYDMAIAVDTERQAYRLFLDGKEISDWLSLGQPRVESVERLVFRTGPYRGIDTRPIEPAVDRPIPATVFYVNEVRTI